MNSSATKKLPLLAPLSAARYELAEWKQATVQFNYHISVDGMLYSIPYEYIGKKVDVRITGTVIEVFYNQNRIASHRRLYGRKNQYSTVHEVSRIRQSVLVSRTGSASLLMRIVTSFMNTSIVWELSRFVWCICDAICCSGR